MKGAWCYDWEIKCALGRFYCECGLWCTYSSSPWCVWPCVTMSQPGAVWTEPPGLWASPFGWGWLPGLRMHPLSCAGLFSLATLCSDARAGTEGCGGHGQFRVKALRRTGFFIQRFYKFSLLLRLYSLFFWHWKVPIVVCGVFGVYGRAHCMRVVDPVISCLHELLHLPFQPGNGEQTVLMENSLERTLVQIYFSAENVKCSFTAWVSLQSLTSFLL